MIERHQFTGLGAKDWLTGKDMYQPIQRDRMNFIPRQVTSRQDLPPEATGREKEKGVLDIWRANQQGAHRK